MRSQKKINYFSLRPIKKVGRAFNFILGGRGVGKTFNSINEDVDDKVPFIYMRRTQEEVDLIGSNDQDLSLSPFAKINARTNDEKFPDLIGKQLQMKKINKKVWNVTNGIETPEHVGLCLALSTIASIRGFDGDIYNDLLVDEFIPERHVHKIGKGDSEGEAHLNAYETINRDRELIGRPPLQAFYMSNANNIEHPLLEILGLMNVIERMKKKGQHFIDLPDKDCTITLYEDREFKEAKKKTALYRLTKGTAFYKMAIDNDFVYNDFSLIKSMPLIEYKPICQFDDICIYQHKSNGTFYVSPHIVKCEKYTRSDNDVQNFYMTHGRYLYGAYVTGCVIFENYTVKKRLLEVII